ncbi:MAG: hypothetical protein AWM53_01189 [Candidatus Dichloromethanomonas elyunquensis]|nr:MAG: hypothetical protein AWM53_01189 [Candidatus Dichloromethanomonas elyunquensis]
MILFLLGVILGVLAVKLWEIKQAKNIHFSKLEYAIGIIWILWVLFGGIFVVDSLGEGETRAASLAALIFGGIALLVLLGMRQLYLRRKRIVPPSNSINA